jgi:genetic interactor of prohibitins 3, mitochondrial
MHRGFSRRWLSNALRTTDRSHSLELPVFLCPTLASHHSRLDVFRGKVPTVPSPWRAPSRSLHVQTDAPTATATLDHEHALKPVRKLPGQCTGCGALSQTAQPDLPGYFDLGRKAVRRYIGLDQPQSRGRRDDDHGEEEEVFRRTLHSMDPAELDRLGVDVDNVVPTLTPPEPEAGTPKTPLCDRCHNLLHHQTGVSIHHPTIDSVRDTLAESPYKYNHVYHVLDAADFPMSLLPKIHSLLDLMPLRSKNRRSRAGKFYHGQKTEMSFIITRADLLAPTKSQVDRLIPYFREVLRDALGRAGADLRLGNLRCVSAKRGWWTKELKEDIWKRGGAGWMVGKVNVGKSQLFEAVYPKGRMDWKPTGHQINIDMYPKENVAEEAQSSNLVAEGEDDDHELIAKLEAEKLDEYSLLPPAPPEKQYPDMPLVSDLPGTTASPIRVPFGNGRGELIDLPGLVRTGLENHVQDEHRTSLVMRSRTVPEQMVLKPGQSLLLGN